MSGKRDYVLRLLVKRLERLPRRTRQNINWLLDSIGLMRTFREKKFLRSLSSFAVTKKFEIDRKRGFSKFESDPETTNKMVNFALGVKKKHLEGGMSRGNSKDYLRQIWDLSQLDAESIFILKWALQPSNLKSISEYFGGKTPILHEVSVFYSPETGATDRDKWQGSQLFHMDGGGTQCVKLWLLCQDVTDEQGPTVVVAAEQSTRLAKKLKYKPGTRILEDKTLSNLEKLDTFALVGKKGTWYATDTDRSFHYGSRTTEKTSRLVLMFHYVDNNSSYYMPLLSKHYRKQIKPLPKIAETVVLEKNVLLEPLKHRLQN